MLPQQQQQNLNKQKTKWSERVTTVYVCLCVEGDWWRWRCWRCLQWTLVGSSHLSRTDCLSPGNSIAPGVDTPTALAGQRESPLNSHLGDLSYKVLGLLASLLWLWREKPHSAASSSPLGPEDRAPLRLSRTVDRTWALMTSLSCPINHLSRPASGFCYMRYSFVLFENWGYKLLVEESIKAERYWKTQSLKLSHHTGTPGLWLQRPARPSSWLLSRSMSPTLALLSWAPNPIPLIFLVSVKASPSACLLKPRPWVTSAISSSLTCQFPLGHCRFYSLNIPQIRPLLCPTSSFACFTAAASERVLPLLPIGFAHYSQNDLSKMQI